MSLKELQDNLKLAIDIASQVTPSVQGKITMEKLEKAKLNLTEHNDNIKIAVINLNQKKIDENKKQQQTENNGNVGVGGNVFIRNVNDNDKSKTVTPMENQQKQITIERTLPLTKDSENESLNNGKLFFFYHFSFILN